MRNRCMIVAFLLLAALSSCDQKPDAPTFVPIEPESGPQFQIELQPLTPLAKNVPTHVAIDSVGNFCWVQETDQGNDAMFVMGDDKVPHASILTSSRICDALNEPGGTGNMQSIAAGRNGDIFFYFLGVKVKRTIACLGLYSNKTGTLRILADTNAVMTGSGLGHSIGLARGDVISHGNSYWLWLRQPDDYALMHLRYSDIPRSGGVALESARVNVRMQDHRVDLTSPNYALVPVDDESLFWLDRNEAMLYRIDVNGYVTFYKSLVGMPVAMSTPVVDAQQRVVMFFADSPQADVKNLNQIDLPRLNVKTKYPALIMIDQDAIRKVPADRISAYPGISLSAMRINELIPVPRSSDYLAYDVTSGGLLRMNVRQRE